MSVPVQDPINQIVIVGGETLIPWTWNLQSENEITVLVLRALDSSIDLLILDTDYTVDANGLNNDSGGNITPIGAESPVTTGDIWTMFRKSSLDRADNFAKSGAFFALTINKQLDELTRIVQDINRDSVEAVRKDPGVGDALNPLIPQPVDERALKFRDTGGGNFEMFMSEFDPDVQASAAAASAAAALASEQAAAASEANAASSESNASTSETNAGNSETAAGDSETNAGNSETNAGNSETAAGISETAAGVSETNAGNSETAAGISETNAATSETNAGNSETAAGISETNAGNSETAAGISETNAGISEVNAANSAASINLPTLQGGDAGKRLEVNVGEDGYDLVAPPVPAVFRGALVTKSANQSIGGGSFITITWNSETYDTDTIHDNSTNNSRLTVPSGVTFVRLTGNITWLQGVTVDSMNEMYLRKNGVDVIGGFRNGEEDGVSISGNRIAQNGVSAPLQVTGGDYFEIIVRQGHSFPGTVEANSGIGTWFSMEIL